MFSEYFFSGSKILGQKLTGGPASLVDVHVELAVAVAKANMRANGEGHVPLHRPEMLNSSGLS